MEIVVNGKTMIVEENCTVIKLLDQMGLNGRGAIWVNGVQVWMKDYPTMLLKNGDKIKVIRVLGGG